MATLFLSIITQRETNLDRQINLSSITPQGDAYILCFLEKMKSYFEFLAMAVASVVAAVHHYGTTHAARDIVSRGVLGFSFSNSHSYSCVLLLLFG
jgi:hypothetical protein